MADKHTKNGDRDLHSRIARLNRGALDARPAPRPAAEDLKRALRKKRRRKKPERPDQIIYRRDLPRQVSTPYRAVAQPGQKVTLEEAVDGTEVSHPKQGKGFLVESRIDDPDSAASVSKTFETAAASDESSLRKRVASSCGLGSFAPTDVVFLDLETTGLGNSPLFLIGTMLWNDGSFVVRQYLARNYAEEAAVISLFLEACDGKRLLVTFNGKSFDVPYVRTRSVANGIPYPFVPAHFDMLHECRRIWKDVLPNCKLQTLESHICGRARCGDIPGEEIPEAYHAYVRTENAWQMVEVLKHNMLDLITMADLMTRFPEP